MGRRRRGGRKRRALTASSAMDMWSLGVCLLEMATGHDLAFHLEVGEGNDAMRAFVCSSSDAEVQERVNGMLRRVLGERRDGGALKRVLQGLLCVDPSLRLSAAACLNKSFFSRGRTTEAEDVRGLLGQVIKRLDEIGGDGEEAKSEAERLLEEVHENQVMLMQLREQMGDLELSGETKARVEEVLGSMESAGSSEELKKRLIEGRTLR